MNRRIHIWLLGPALLLMSVTAACNTGPESSGAGRASPPPSSIASTDGVAGPRNGIQEARLDLSAGAGQITVQASSLGSTLYRVTDGGGTAPQVSFNAPILNVGSPNRANGQMNPQVLAVVLNDEVRWTLNLNGGSTHELVDMRSGHIQSLTLAAGANEMDVELGPPHGVIPVRVTGGTSQIALRIPDAAAATVHLGGANSVTINGRSRGRVTGSATFGVGSSTTDRYNVDLMAGLNTLTIDQG